MIRTLDEALALRAAARPEQPAIVWRAAAVSYAELNARATAGASHLIRAGVLPGDRVVVDLPNGPDLVTAYYACFRAGAVVVPVPKGFSREEVARIVEQCRPRVGVVAASGRDAPSPEMRWISVDSGPPSAANDVVLPSIDAGDLALIVYTSGTTGWEKAVMHTHASLLGWLNAVGARPYTGDRVLVALPLVHAYALLTMVSRLSLGDTVILQEAFEAGDMLDAIDRHGATTAIATPAMAHALADAQLAAPRRLTSLQRVNVSGDTVPVQLQERFRRVFGDRMRRTYGSTEVAPIASETAGAVSANSLGRPFQGVDVRILDDAGRELGVGETGEIVVRSPSMAVGYWGDEAATSAVFRGGCFHTGDLAWREADGRLFFAGRAKEIIVRAGRNISPRQVEDVLRRHPAVADVAVWGLPDDVLGQRVAAWVVARSVVSPAEIQEYVRPLLAEHKWPERVLFVSDLPRSAAGKINRRRLCSLS